MVSRAQAIAPNGGSALESATFHVKVCKSAEGVEPALQKSYISAPCSTLEDFIVGVRDQDGIWRSQVAGRSILEQG